MAASPFDALAADYDAQFTHTFVGSAQRRAVWRRLEARFVAGQQVLELGCGTGEDAIHLGQRGIQVLATDASEAMVEAARRKVSERGLEARVRVQRLAIEELARLDQAPFDGAVSNFGALNCVEDVAVVGRQLAARLRPGAVALLCVMGPLVPWEWVWFLGQGLPRKAFRRLQRGGVDWRGLRIRYPSPDQVWRAFSPAFRPLRVAAVGALVPPSYAERWAAAHPRVLGWIERCERRLETVPPLPWLSDHYLLELERV